MQNRNNKLFDEVSKYYSAKLEQFGDTPNGVDWNSEGGQIVRFEQLCKVIKSKECGFSLNDLGCGYGALATYLHNHYSNYRYLGIDVSSEMVQAAVKRIPHSENVRFLVDSKPDQKADYGMASGIFNVRLGHSEIEWTNYVESTLDLLNQTSKLGFAFNCLTSYSDQDKKRDELYYADPCRLFDFCKRRYSLQVALLHDYGLYEFTILVRKE